MLSLGTSISSELEPELLPTADPLDELEALGAFVFEVFLVDGLVVSSATSAEEDDEEEESESSSPADVCFFLEMVDLLEAESVSPALVVPPVDDDCVAVKDMMLSIFSCAAAFSDDVALVVLVGVDVVGAGVCTPVFWYVVVAVLVAVLVAVAAVVVVEDAVLDTVFVAVLTAVDAVFVAVLAALEAVLVTV